MSQDIQKHFSDKEKKFFNKMLPYMKKSDSVLKIGNGFGYLSKFIEEYVQTLNIFEINIHDKTINKDRVTLYDGKTYQLKISLTM